MDVNAAAVNGKRFGGLSETGSRDVIMYTGIRCTCQFEMYACSPGIEMDLLFYNFLPRVSCPSSPPLRIAIWCVRAGHIHASTCFNNFHTAASTNSIRLISNFLSL